MFVQSYSQNCVISLKKKNQFTGIITIKATRKLYMVSIKGLFVDYIIITSWLHSAPDACRWTAEDFSSCAISV